MAKGDVKDEFETTLPESDAMYYAYCQINAFQYEGNTIQVGDRRLDVMTTFKGGQDEVVLNPLNTVFSSVESHPNVWFICHLTWNTSGNFETILPNHGA
ncbi:MAG: hypothetical protein AAF570_17755 [Bacteroidota bacterium]